MSTPRPFRALLLGYGLAGRVFHAPLIAATTGLRLSAVVTSDDERAAQVHHEHPSVEVIDAAEGALARAEEFDLAVVATANVAHVPLATALLERGVHVVVDKPLAPDAETARTLADLAARVDRQLHTFHNRRWDGDFLTLQQLVAQGRLGTIHRFESRFERWRPTLTGAWRERAGPEMGGLLYDLMPHLVDQAIQLLGPVVDVHAELVSVRGGDADDDTFLALTHADGARSHLWAAAVAAHLGPRFRVLGDQGAWVVDGLDGQEAALRSGADPRAADFGVEPGRGSLLLPAGRAIPLLPGRWTSYYPAVVASIRGDGPAPVPTDQVLAVLEVLDDARSSASTSRRLTSSD